MNEMSLDELVAVLVTGPLLAIVARCKRHHRCHLARAYLDNGEMVVVCLDTTTQTQPSVEELIELRREWGSNLAAPHGGRVRGWYLRDFEGGFGWCPACQHRRELPAVALIEAAALWKSVSGLVTIHV